MPVELVELMRGVRARSTNGLTADNGAGERRMELALAQQ
jgi:hypothetical protein